jgi:uncharacterized metal-binding protein YceD (DUF177 family)
MSNPEFSRPVRIDTIGDKPHGITIGANEQERIALASRFGLISIERLEAEAQVARTGDTIMVSSGRLKAAVTQACVASGEPVAATIDEPFDLRFVPEGGGAEEEIELAEGDLDVIGYEGSAVDLGEAAAQTLALALDPFPRAPNADTALKEAGVIDEESAGPFGALKALRDTMK